VVLVRAPLLPFGSGRDKPTKAERATGLFFSLGGRYGRDVFDRYRSVAGALRYIAAPEKGQIGDGPACARAVAALQSAGFEVRAHDEDAAARLRAACAIVGGVVADANTRVSEVCAALQARGLTPRLYQIVGIKWLRSSKAGALLDVMGLGKTMQVLLAMGDRGIVFCPSSVKGVWRREAALWRPDLRVSVLDGRDSMEGDDPTCAAVVPSCEAAGAEGCAALEPLCSSPPAGFGRGKATKKTLLGADSCAAKAKPSTVRSVDAGAPIFCWRLGADTCDPVAIAPGAAAASDPVDRAQRCSGSFRWPDPGELVVVNYDIVTPDDVTASGAAPRGTTIAIDEGHVVKNAASLRAKAITAACSMVEAAAGWRWLVTATPICNRPKELKAVLEAIGAFKTAFSSWSAYKRAFGGAIDSAEAVPTGEATIALARVSLRRTKDMVAADLPPVTWVRVPVAITGQAAALAAVIEAKARPLVEAAELEARAAGAGEEATASAIEAALKASSEIGEMAAARRVIALAKLPAALDLVETCEAAGDPVLVVSAHREVCEILGARPGWGAIMGGVSDAERERLVAAMQAGELAGLALTIRAGGVGITLTRATIGIGIDEEWNPSLNEQAYARNDPSRRDREDKAALYGACTWYLLRGDAWIEERVEALTMSKVKMIAATMSRVAELGGQVAAVADLADVAVGPVPAPTAPSPILIPDALPVPRGWTADPALLARVQALAVEPLAASVARVWLAARIAERGAVPRQIQGRSIEDVVASCEVDLARRKIAAAEDETVRLETARPPLDDAEQHAAFALVALAGADPDRARERNEEGFSASDGAQGHALAAAWERSGTLTPEEWASALRLARRYVRQVGVAPAGAA
jgi:hypothetical protein